NKLIVAKTLDYETLSQHSIIVTATDPNGMSLSQAFNISVIDVAEVNAPPRILIGSRQSDTLVGGKHDNWIYGAAGHDLLLGHGGNDRLYGEYGKDTLYGGSGKDIFVFNAKLGTSKTDRKVNFDTIKDFSVKDDTIWLD